MLITVVTIIFVLAIIPVTRPVTVGSPGLNTNLTETMRILLQHTRTGLYFRGSGDWTADPYVAFDFQHSQKAIDYACKHGVIGVQIAVRFVGSERDEIMQLPANVANSVAGRSVIVNS